MWEGNVRCVDAITQYLFFATQRRCCPVYDWVRMYVWGLVFSLNSMLFDCNPGYSLGLFV